MQMDTPSALAESMSKSLAVRRASEPRTDSLSTQPYYVPADPIPLLLLNPEPVLRQVQPRDYQKLIHQNHYSMTPIASIAPVVGPQTPWGDDGIPLDSNTPLVRKNPLTGEYYYDQSPPLVPSYNEIMQQQTSATQPMASHYQALPSSSRLTPARLAFLAPPLVQDPRAPAHLDLTSHAHLATHQQQFPPTEAIYIQDSNSPYYQNRSQPALMRSFSSPFPYSSTHAHAPLQVTLSQAPPPSIAQSSRPPSARGDDSPLTIEQQEREYRQYQHSDYQDDSVSPLGSPYRSHATLASDHRYGTGHSSNMITRHGADGNGATEHFVYVASGQEGPAVVTPPAFGRGSGSRVSLIGTTPTVDGQHPIKPFASKLGYMLKNPELYGDLICWDASGKSFFVAHTNERLIKEVLPLIYSHSSMQSFQRQLNIYEFKHVPPLEVIQKARHTTIAGNSDISGFTHPYFVRDGDATLHLLKPRPSRARAAKKKEKDSLGFREKVRYERKPKFHFDSEEDDDDDEGRFYD